MGIHRPKSISLTSPKDKGVRKMFLKADLSGVKVGLGESVKVIGAINLSPESFYKDSVAKSPEEALRIAEKMVEQGASIIDIGGMSTAPYLNTYVSEEEEIRRVIPAIKRIKDLGIPISIDTKRYEVALRAVEAGASIVNDVSGLSDDRMADLVSSMDLSLIMGAFGRPESSNPLKEIRRFISEGLRRAYGIKEDRIVVDPLIGFFREQDKPWYIWDSEVLRGLSSLLIMGRPICVSVSRKSFIGKIAGEEDPRRRLPGSIAATAIAVYNGASVVRTHDVWETVQAVKIAEFMRKNIEVYKEDIEAYLMPVGMKEEDFEDLYLRIGAHPYGAREVASKSETRVLYIRGVSNPVAIVIKQEMLASGGDAAVPASTIVFGQERVDLVIAGNMKQLRRLAEKMELNAKEGKNLSKEFLSVKEAISSLISR
jgi:dihydropteroate synthase